jgi:membrane fusion protein, copper/silver efflux system
MMRVACICVALSFSVVAAGGGGDVLAQGGPSPSAATGGTPLYYQDPDGKPDYSRIPKKTEDGRDYVSVYEEPGAPAAAASPTKPAAESPSKGRILYYRNPMGLPDTSPVPKKDSMGMDYIPVYESAAEPGVVTVAPGRLQLLGVRTAPVERRPALTHTARATATVAFDERRFAVVTTKVAGWIEKLDVAATGDPVRQGQALAWIYSPELVAAEEEYLLVAHIPHSGRHGDPASLGIAALRRLHALDIPEEEIARLRRSGTVSRRIAVHAPADGVVIEKPVVAGMRIAAGEPLYKIADLSTVWLIAEVQESDIGFVRPGEKSRASAVAFPGRTFDGVVDFIYPTLSRDTRTARVRIVVPNHDLALRGDMYASVEIDAPTGREAVLVVPESAVIDSGARQVVLVERGEGRFAPRAVKVGTRGEGYAQILEGVQEGERVVVGANFLIDAESNLRAALEGFTAGSQGGAK